MEDRSLCELILIDIRDSEINLKSSQGDNILGVVPTRSQPLNCEDLIRAI